MIHGKTQMTVYKLQYKQMKRTVNTLRWAELVLGWVTVLGCNFWCGKFIWMKSTIQVNSAWYYFVHRRNVSILA